MNWFTKIFSPGETPRPRPSEGMMEMPARVSRPAPSAGNSSLPGFRQRAGSILMRGQGGDAADARAMIRETFTPSQPINQRERFAGRRQLLQDLIVALEDQQLHFVLYGDRGIGKTSILRVLSQQAQDAGYIVTYVSCSEGLGFNDLARRVAQRIPVLHHADYEPGSDEIERGLSFLDILPAGPLDVPTFSEALGRLSDTRLLIMLDEFDRVVSDDFRRSIAELIKNLSDNAAPAQLVIAGVASDLAELIAQIPSIRRNVRGVLVPNMEQAEVAEMLDTAERSTGLTFLPPARELVAVASLGLPYLVHLIAQHAAFVTTDRGELTVDQNDVRAAVARARADLAARLSAATLYAVERCVADGQLVTYGKLAHLALENGGAIPAASVPDTDRGNAPGSGRDGRAAMIEPIEADPMDRWRFADDGAAMYLWLSALTQG